MNTTKFELKNFNHCESCKKEIAFLKTKSGKFIPVNIDSLSNQEKQKLSEGKRIFFQFTRHTSHFATCPNASIFRKPKP